MRSRSRPRRLRIVALSLVLLGTAIPSLAAIAAAASGGVRAGLYRLASAPAIPASAFDLGGTSSDQTVDLSITLTSADPAGLTQAAEEISDPTSPEYGQFLTTEQATSLYGPNPTQAAAVTSWLEGQGLDVGSALGDGLVLPVKGTASQVASAFDTSLSNYWLSSGRLAYANTASPEIPSALASSIHSVIGLNTLVQLGSDTEDMPAHRALPAKTAKAATKATVRPLTGLQTASAPTPCSQFATDAGNASNADTTQFVSHYDIGALYTDNYTGSGITVALLEGGEEYSTNDVAAFNNCYSTSTSVTAVPVDGGCTSSCTTVGVESTMDIETVMGFAPGATIDVLQAPDLSDASLLADEAEAVSLDAQTVSASLGDCEPEAESDSGFMSSESTQFQLMATQGQTMFASSGDWGSQACLTYDDGTHSDPSFLTQLAVSDPGSQPWVTGVGGTTINNPSTPSTASESVWNEGPETDWSGNLVDTGGISDVWTMPSWQVGFDSSGNSSGTPCGATQGSYCREVPDVSATANPNNLGYLYVYDCPSTSIATCSSDRDIDVAGGTSFGSPFWAALTALADQGAPPSHRLGFLNPALYRADTANPSVFNDVTSGNDNYLYPATGSPSNVYGSSAGYTCTYGGTHNLPCYEATAGYDMATGLGSPFAGPLFGLIDSFVRVGTTSLPQATVGVGYSQGVSIASGTGTSPFTWQMTSGSLPTGMQLNTSTGAITGTATTTGTYTFTVKVTDSTTLSATSQLNIVVNATPRIVTTSVPAATVGQPSTYSTTLSASGGTGSLSWSVQGGALPSGLTLSSGGVLSGTPTNATTSNFTASVDDANGAVAMQTIPVIVNSAPSVFTTSLSTATVGRQYSTSLVSSGGTAPLAWSLLNGALPNGISLSASGLISGIPTTASSPSFTVQVTDANGAVSNQSLSLNVASDPAISTDTLPLGTVGSAYSTSLSESGGATPVNWSLENGSALPPGLFLASDGTISGTPTVAGDTIFTVGITDANGLTVNQSLAIVVSIPPGSPVPSSPTPTATSKSAPKLTVSKSTSGVVASPSSVAANGSASAEVNVTLRTVGGSAVSGRAVSLHAQSGSSKVTVVSRTTNNKGVATFSVTDAVVQAVTYSATDTSNGIALKSTTTVHFTKPPPITPRSVVVSATRSSFGVTPVTVRSCPAAGGQSVITVVLRSPSGTLISGRTVTVVKPASFKGSVSPSSATTNSSGSVTFTLTDKTAQTAAFGARDTTNNVVVAGSKAVAFVAKRC